MAIYKRCGRCHKRLPSGTKCECLKKRHIEYDRTSRDSKRAAFYKSAEWKSIRKKSMDRYVGNDIYSFYILGKVETADMVHHIIPISDDWNSRLDIDNLIPLTNRNHEKLHYRMEHGEKDKVIAELREVQKRWERDNII